MKVRKKVALEAMYSLSPMQQGMLFNALYHDGGHTDFLQQRYILSGNLDASLLRTAWSQVVARHAVLRTQFRWEDVKQPLQIVWQTCDLPWVEYDWSHCSADEQEQRLRRLLEEDFVQGIDLKKAPLFRLVLIRQAPTVYQLIWSYHHILLDGWSNDIVLQEVVTCYEAGLAGRSPDLPASPAYRHYIHWLQRQDTAQAEQFWRTTLAGFQAANRLRGDPAPTSRAQTITEYHEQQLALEPRLTSQIQRFKQRYRITLNTLVQAAWAYVLACYSGENDIVFGSVVAGRPEEIDGIDSMVGLFVNTLPTRARIEYQQTILAWLRALQEQRLDAHQHAHCSLVDIMRWSMVPREDPLFESIVAFANYQERPGGEQKMGDVSWQFVPTLVGRSTYPLVLSAGIGEQFLCALTYDGKRFTEETITSMLRYIKILLEKMVEDPLQPVASLDLLTAAEKQMILKDWNDSALPVAETAGIAEVFKARVAEQPDALALFFAPQEQHLTYTELDNIVKHVAARLQQQGVGPEVLVGICIECSLEMVIAVLGVLYAGGAYVPLDPAYPQERLAYICEDAALTLLITQKHLRSHCAPPAIPWIDIDECVNGPRLASSVQGSVHADNLAYVIYTSGSTGHAKGVMVAQRGLCNLVEAGARAFGHQRGKRVLQFASLSFDASIWEIVAALGMGGTLVLTSKEELLPGPGLQKTLRQYDITTATLTPSVLAALPPADFPGLQTLITAGEACSTDIVTNWGQTRQLYNAYGPTEGTVCASAGLCRFAEARPAIGGPIANMQLYVLDARLSPLPIGIAGELYLGGIGLARGYLGRPDLTAERFVPHPFSDVPGARIYKTGDLVRWRLDGQLEFLGRLDGQTKLRGFRIELGEIEIALGRLEEIQQCSVVVREDNAGDKRLVAYLIPNAERQIDLKKVQEYLRSQLPYYMVPGALVVMEALPISPNGKVDQRRLPPPHLERAPMGAEQVPRDTFEMQLVQIYEELLDVRPVGLADDFFTLGGHSLLAVRLMAEIQKRLHVHIPLPVIFQHGSVARLAACLRDRAYVPSSPLVAIRAGGSRTPLFLVHPANGQVACYYKLAVHLSPDQPLYGLQDLSLSQKEGQEQSVEEMAQSYIEAIRAVQPEGPYCLGGYSFGGIIAFEMAQQLRAQGQEVAFLAILDGASPTSGGLQSPTALLATIIGEAIRAASGKTVQDVYREMEPLSYEEQLGHALDLLRAAQVELLVMEKDWLKEQVELFARRLRAVHHYHVRAYPGRVSLFRAKERDELEEEGDIPEDLGWQQCTLQPLDIYPVQGYHNTLVNEPHVQELAQQLQQSLCSHLKQAVAEIQSERMRTR